MNSVLRGILSTVAALFLAAVGGAQVTLDLETTTYVPAGATVTTDAQNVVAGVASVATSYGSSSATSTFGSMQLNSTSSGTHTETYGDTLTTRSQAEAKWQDSILVTAAAPELNGTNGRLHARFTVSGNLNVPYPVASTFAGAQPVSANWQVSVNRGYQFGDENSVGGGLSVYIDYTVGPPADIFPVLNGSADFQTYDLVIPFTFGEAFDFRFTGQAQSYVQPRGMEVGDGLGSSASITVTWLGIEEITDEENNPLAGITIASTGAWITASAIPEPSTYAMMAGAAALGLAAWRRRRVSVL